VCIATGIIPLPYFNLHSPLVCRERWAILSVTNDFVHTSAKLFLSWCDSYTRLTPVDPIDPRISFRALSVRPWHCCLSAQIFWDRPTLPLEAWLDTSLGRTGSIILGLRAPLSAYGPDLWPPTLRKKFSIRPEPVSLLLYPAARYCANRVCLCACQPARPASGVPECRCGGDCQPSVVLVGTRNSLLRWRVISKPL